MRVVLIATDFPDLEKYCPNWYGMKKGLERLGIDYKFVSCRPTLDVESVNNFKADLIIYGLLDMVKNKGWRDQIRAKNPNAKIVLWYGDLRNEDTGQVDADCREMDTMFLSNDGQENFYKRKFKMKEVHCLPLGCEPIDKPVYDKKFSFPFVFIGGKITGSNFIARVMEISKFEERGLKVINSFESSLRAKIFQKMPAIYSSSKVSLDISHFTNIKKYTSIRYFEIPAFYGFSLTKRFPGCEEFYPEKVGKVYFDTFEEALELRDYYLSHEKERKEIVEAGHAHSFNHTYDKRFLEMFRVLNLLT